MLCDVRIGKNSGLDLCRKITTQYPDTKVVLLTVYDDEHYLYQALRVGASGYILKRVDGRELVGNLRRIREGETVVDEGPGRSGGTLCCAPQPRGVLGRGAPRPHRAGVGGAGVAGLGHSNEAVASKLVVSEDTVKTHIRGLYRKLGVTDRSGAVAVALREGLFR